MISKGFEVLLVEKLVNEIAHIGYPFKNYGKDADNDGILLEWVHDHNNL
jgi:hypothetical protein